MLFLKLHLILTQIVKKKLDERVYADPNPEMGVGALCIPFPVLPCPVTSLPFIPFSSPPHFYFMIFYEVLSLGIVGSSLDTHVVQIFGRIFGLEFSRTAFVG